MRSRHRCYCSRKKYNRDVCSCFCVDCGLAKREFPIYMLKGELWQRVIAVDPAMNSRQEICPGCAEKRLGRPLTQGDLTTAPCNDSVRGLLKPTMKLVIAGSRGLKASHWRQRVVGLIEELAESIGHPSTIIHGGHPGSPDALGPILAELYKCNEHVEEPDYESAKAHGIPEHVAPLTRNKIMADLGDALIAIWDGVSAGTEDMIEHMERLNKPYIVYRTDRSEVIRGPRQLTLV